MKDNGVRFFVEIGDDSGNRYGGSQYLKFTARAQMWAPERFGADAGTFYLTDPDSYSIQGRRPELDGLVITSQTDTDHAADNHTWYGHSVAYQCRNLDLTGMTERLPVLRRIDRAMRKIAAEFGEPAGLAEYAAHAASSVASAGSPFMRRLAEGEGDFEGTGYRSMTVAQLRTFIRESATAWLVTKEGAYR